MKPLIGFAIYILIGIIGRKAFGYKGLAETVLWPLGIPCAIYLRGTEGDNETDQNIDRP